MRRFAIFAVFYLVAALAPRVAGQDPLESPQVERCQQLLGIAEKDPRLALARAEHPQSRTSYVRGSFEVFENRKMRKGRKIRLHLTILPCRGRKRAPDAIFVLHGGPGAPATQLMRGHWSNWTRAQRDVVFIDQRGTGASNALRVRLRGADDDVQGYLESYFDVKAFKRALPRLRKRADLLQYTTANSVDDFNEIREALGYEKVNLIGGSYGTRAALVYMRRHPQTIRTATLMGVQPISYRNPLPHARSAQNALDQIFEEIRNDPKYRRAFPELEKKFEETLARLAQSPAKVVIRHPRTGKDVEVELSRNAFAEAVRLQLYTLAQNRRLPLLLMQAHAGDYRSLTQAYVAQSRGVRGTIAWGMLLSVTKSEDLCRIDPDEIAAACKGTFLGETRIREQLRIAAFWPSGKVAKDFGNPVRSKIPTLLISGTHDPSTSARWADDAAKHLSNSLHVIVPGGHGVFGPEIRKLQRAFLESGTVKGHDLRALEKLRMPRLVLPL